MSVFSWIDTWQFSYTNWANGFNSSVDQYNKCGYLENYNSFWNTGACDTLNDFICKISKGLKLLFIYYELIVFLMLITDSSTPAPPKCEPTWTETDNSCYKVNI